MVSFLSLRKNECLLISIQMQFFSKPKKFSWFFLRLWHVNQISNIYKKDEPHSWFISEVVDSKKRGYLNA